MSVRNRSIGRASLVSLTISLLVGGLTASCSSDTFVTHGLAEPAAGPVDPGAPPPVDMPSASPTAKAERLVTTGSVDLARQALADHEPTEAERAILGVFWAGILIADTTGEIPPWLLDSGIIGLVSDLAKAYPTFFQVDGTGGVHLLNISSPVACSDNCAPSWTTIVSNAISVAGVVKTVRGLGKVATLQDQVAAAYQAAHAAGLGPVKAALAAAAGGQTDQLLEAVGDTLLGGATLVALGLTPEAVVAVAAVGAIWSAFWIGYNVTTAALASHQCLSWQSSNCCQPSCAAPVVTCQGNYVVTNSESCTDGACMASSALTETCAPPLTCAGGACTCAAPNQMCGGTCKPPSAFDSDAKNCGSCGHACGGTLACAAGQCDPPVCASLAAPTCNSLAQQGTHVVSACSLGTAPVLAGGGVISPGVYVLTARTDYYDTNVTALQGCQRSNLGNAHTIVVCGGGLMQSDHSSEV